VCYVWENGGCHHAPTNGKCLFEDEFLAYGENKWHVNYLSAVVVIRGCWG